MSGAVVSSLVWTLILSSPVERAQVQLNCSEETRSIHLCELACGDSRHCEFREGVCRNCSGTGASPWIRFLKGVASGQLQSGEVGGDWGNGQQFDGLGEEAVKERVRFLKEGRWVLAHAETPWNFVTPWNDPRLRRGFSQLCENQDPAAWVFFELDEWGTPLRPLGVVCSPSG
jgi:hypothetical protein